MKNRCFYIFILFVFLLISCSTKYYRHDLQLESSFISDGIFKTKFDEKDFSGFLIIKKLDETYFFEAKLNSIIPFTILSAEISQNKLLFINYYEKKYSIETSESEKLNKIYDLIISIFFYHKKSEYFQVSFYEEVRKSIITEFGTVNILYEKKDNYYLLKEAKIENEKYFLVYKQNNIRGIQEKKDDLNFHLKIPDNFDILE